MMNSRSLLSVLYAVQLFLVASGEAINPRHVVIKRLAATVSGASAVTPPPQAATSTSIPAATGTGIPPLSVISSGMPTRTSRAAVTTYTPGAQPPISGAPPLPTLATAGQ